MDDSNKTNPNEKKVTTPNIAGTGRLTYNGNIRIPGQKDFDEDIQIKKPEPTKKKQEAEEDESVKIFASAYQQQRKSVQPENRPQTNYRQPNGYMQSDNSLSQRNYDQSENNNRQSNHTQPNNNQQGNYVHDGSSNGQNNYSRQSNNQQGNYAQPNNSRRATTVEKQAVRRATAIENQDVRLGNNSAVHEKSKKTDSNDVKVLSRKNNDDDEKYRIPTIFLIIFTIAIFTATVFFLIFGNAFSQKKGVVSENPYYAADIKSAVLQSPFDYQQTYDVTFPNGMQDKYKALYAQNTDFVGWLNVPGTSIDSPVYKTTDNTYYLKHDNYGNYTKYGIPFLDMYDGVSTLSKNTAIYGHNFSNELIFDEIQNYEDIDFYRENPVIEFNTIYKDYKWKVIACFRTNGDSVDDNGYLFYYVAAEMGNNSFLDFYNEIMQRSYIDTSSAVDIQGTDRLLTLSTCTYFFDRNGSLENARFALIARLVRDGESEDVNTDGVSYNENVRYPQLYYDVFGGSNPYKDASKWIASND